MRKIILAAALGLTLAACDTAEERAAKHLATAQTLIAEGDIDRALVELRNALQKNPKLREARLLFADLLMDKGRVSDASGQYVVMVETDPKDIDANAALAGIAIDSNAWDQAGKYAQAAQAALQAAGQEPEPELDAILAAVQYRTASGPQADVAGRDAALAKARALIAADPSLVVARRILIAEAMRLNDANTALNEINEGLKYLPDDRDLNSVRLAVLARLDDKPAIEEQILRLVELFPEDQNFAGALIQFYMSAGRVDDASNWLLSKIDPANEKPDARLTYLRFLSGAVSNEAMRTALRDMLAEDPAPADIAADPMTFKALMAGADYVAGEQDKAMADLATLLEGTEKSEQTDRVRVQLAKMMAETGNNVGSRALVEEVLEHDAGQVDAIKMKAAWLIMDDKTDEAIRLLRAALSNAPDDVQALTLLSQAYEREGRTELMADMLSRAVEASRNAPETSLRYATYLNTVGEPRIAETVLIDALRQQPNNVPLLVMLTRTHMAMQDWGRAEQDVAALRRQTQVPEAAAVADELQAQMLMVRNKGDELTAFLEQLATQSDGAASAQIALIRNAVRTGQLDAALVDAEKLVQAEPDNPGVALLYAQVKGANGQEAEARTLIEGLTTRFPEFEEGWTTLASLQIAAGDAAGAQTTVAAARAAIPDSRNLSLASATLLERAGDIAGAIAIYEDLYAKNSEDLVVANNLASLLSVSTTDQVAVDRAWVVARRLRNAQVPAFLDTYGWLAFLQNDLAEARTALEKAARGMPEEPTIAYHLGRVYAALKMTVEARAEFERSRGLLAQGAFAVGDLGAQVEQAVKDLDTANQ